MSNNNIKIIKKNNIYNHISIAGSNSDHNKHLELQFKAIMDSSMKNTSVKPETGCVAKPKPMGSKVPIHTAQTIRSDFQNATHRCKASASSASNIIMTLMDTLDSEARFSQDHGQQNLQGLQFLTMTQQIRDANATIENLRHVAAILQQHFNTLEHQYNHTQFWLKLLQSPQEPLPRDSSGRCMYECRI